MYEYDLLMAPKQLGRRVRRLRLRLQSKNQGDFFFWGGGGGVVVTAEGPPSAKENKGT